MEPDEELAEVEASGSGEFCPMDGDLLPLDQAVIQSIQKCGRYQFPIFLWKYL